MNMMVSFILPNARVSSTLAPNSRAHWRVRYAVSHTCQQQAGIALKQALREQGLETLQPPIRLTCFRRYDGKQKRYDFDNLPSTFKGYIDGIKKALEFDDDPMHMRMRFYQERADRTELEFVLEEVGK